jgi:branched-chain amino acid transport system substrate-binding protein
MQRKLAGILFAALSAQTGFAHADINIGIVGSFTGVAAAIGQDTKKTIALMPATIGGEKVNYIALDDTSDPTLAGQATRRLAMESKVDAIIGPNINPSAAAMTVIADETLTPLVVITPYVPPPERQKWVFQAVQTAGLMVDRLVEDMVEQKVKSIGFIGFADSWGELLLNEFQRAAKGKDIKVLADERYRRSDASVTAQVLKVLAAKPDAVFIGASSTPAALPQVELRQRGFTGKIYQSHGATTRDFIRIGGKNVEGARIPTSPMLVAEQLPDTMATKKAGVEFKRNYEKLYGPGSASTFAGYTWDAFALIANAVPGALKVAKPGTPEFRAALRDGMERTKDLVGATGVYSLTPTNHNGLDARARVLMEVKDGDWKYVK